MNPAPQHPVLPGQAEGTQFQTLVWSGLRALGAVASRFAPEPTAAWAARSFRTPRRHPRPERESAWLDSAARVHIPYQAPPGGDPDAPRELAGWSFGAGPAVLLVHGWEGRGAQLAAVAEPLVAAGLRVLAYDAPAHGESGGRMASLPEFARGVECAAHFAALEGSPLAGIVAHSFGTAAVALALTQGLHAERLVLISTPEELDVYLRLFTAAFGLSDRVRRTMIARFEERLAIDWNELHLVTQTAADATPVLFVHDECDLETPLAGARNVAERWPSSDLLVTQGLGHRRLLRDEQVVLRIAEHVAHEPSIASRVR